MSRFGRALEQGFGAVRRTAGAARTAIRHRLEPLRTRSISPPARALAWLRDNELPSGGMRTHSQHGSAYQEVTGYLIPTLLANGERELADRCAEWLVRVQQGDGSFVDPDAGEPYAFDTGQALRGLLAACDRVAGAREAAQRAVEFLVGRMVERGRSGFSPRYAGMPVPETIHLYALPPLIESAAVLGRPNLEGAARTCAEYYRGHPDFLRLSDLTHFLAYEIEALLDLDLADDALPVLAALARVQRDDGSVRGRGEVRWVCTPGLAQLALCWYRAGMPEAADRALGWLERHQEPSGGFRGSYGRGAAYFPDAELPWAAKYYLDAHRLRVVSHFDRHEATFPSAVGPGDGRLAAVLRHVRPGDRVLEVGCGKGRFLTAIAAAKRGVACTGVDPSAAVDALPPFIEGVRGALESIPLPDHGFDVVFSVEALEHSPNPRQAVRELVRVAQPGGWVVIVDKLRSQWGRLQCPPWEVWPDRDELLGQLAEFCEETSVESVSYDDRPADDGLMAAWSGRTRPQAATGSNSGHV